MFHDAGISWSSTKVLDQRDVAAALAVCGRDPVANVFVASRIVASSLAPRVTGGHLWGWYDGGALRSLCWSGANLVPVEATEQALDAFAARARRSGRRCSSVVGPADQALGLWHRLSRDWGYVRDVRADQPLMLCDTAPAVAPDPRVRLSRPDEIDLVLPACVAMFTEEVGYSPVAADGGTLYRSQVQALVAAGRSLVVVDDSGPVPQVLFKAEIGSATADAVQVQGVWVHPDHRGRGLAAPAMAAVVLWARTHLAPRVSLYVNAYNERALRTYLRVGFRQVGTFATVLF